MKRDYISNVACKCSMKFDVPEKFSVVSYNILAERNTWKHRGLYPNVPSPYLKWNHRKRVICEELLMWNPDIICLQVSLIFSRSLLLIIVMKGEKCSCLSIPCRKWTSILMFQKSWRKPVTLGHTR